MKKENSISNSKHLLLKQKYVALNALSKLLFFNGDKAKQFYDWRFTTIFGHQASNALFMSLVSVSAKEYNNHTVLSITDQLNYSLLEKNGVLLKCPGLVTPTVATIHHHHHD